MNSREIVELCKKHSLYTWRKNDDFTPLAIDRAEGVYIYTTDGARLLDFNSQVMSVNVGHGHPRIIAAIKAQLDRFAFVYPGSATEVRARTSALLARVVPGDINTFFYTLGGAEANENAVRVARLYSGRSKILCRHRSYHGGTYLALAMSGDPRRRHVEPGPPGIVHVLPPESHGHSFGSSSSECVARNLAYLEEVIQYEGPQSIAAMFVEPVIGTNGFVAPLPGYLEGLQALLRRHRILLICDEVLTGFGRTGRMFAFEHAGISPDIVTMAKGLTSSYVPLGAVGVSDPIADHFRRNVLWAGLTYNSHPLALAAAEAAVTVLLDERLVDNAAKLGAVMKMQMDRLAERHPSVREGRSIGLCGALELRRRGPGGSGPFDEPEPATRELVQRLVKNGLFTLSSAANVWCNPPLCITEAQLLEGFEILDEALLVTDSG